MILWAAASGVLLTLAFPKAQIPLLALVALVPFLIALRSTRSLRRSLLLGFVWGLGFFVFLIYWIAEVIIHFGHQDPVTGWTVCVLLVLMMSLFPMLFAFVFGVANRAFPQWGWLFAPTAWTSVEWLRNYIPMGGFPWGQLGYAMVPNLGFMQVTSWTGIYGATFLTALCNALLAERIAPPEGQKLRLQKRLQLAAALALVSIWACGFVYVSLPGARSETGEPLRVTVIQGNVLYDNDPAEAKRTFDEFYAAATREAYRRGAQVVIWPESPTPYSFFSDEAYRRRVEDLVREGHGALILNDITERELPDAHQYFNSAVVLDPQARVAALYSKTHLVPFGEYLPLADWLGRAEALTREVSAFTAGVGPVVANLGHSTVGCFICYEAIFPELVRNYADRGVDWLVNITNDAWYGNTSAPYQHLQMAVVRAIENRRYLVRGANSGVSAIINPLGEVLDRSGLFRREVLDGRIYPRQGRTAYHRIGDGLAWGCAIITVLWFGFCLRVLLTGD